MAASLDYIDHLRRESARFAACLAGADASRRVPTCPEWTADDLLWHLTEVQLFWAVIVRDRLLDPEPADAAAPPRPATRPALLTLFAHATTQLADALSATPPETEIWTWSADHHVAFVRRWQAHEALMHRIDAELLTGDSTPVDPDLASDGVGVALTVVYSDAEDWATFTPDGATGLIRADDTAAEWPITLGRFTGTSPSTGTVYDRDSLALLDTSASEPTFTVRGDVAAVDSWLWGRGPASRLAFDGDGKARSRLEQIVSRGVQ